MLRIAQLQRDSMAFQESQDTAREFRPQVSTPHHRLVETIGTTVRPITSVLRRLADDTKVLHLTPWFAVFGAIAALANLLLGNHITFGFWVASMALPGLVLDLSRMLNGGRAWERKEGWFTKRTVAAVVILVAIAAPLEAVLDHLGGYQSTNALVNDDWSQLSDAVALSVALPVARQFLHWSKPKNGSTSRPTPAQT